MKTLIDMERGQKARVISIEGGGSCKDRLKALGLREGLSVNKLTKASARGPVIVKIGSTQVALGRGLASRIFVEID